MESITLTEKELFRLNIVQRVVNGDLGYADASCELNLSRRQVMHLAKRLRRKGPAAFASTINRGDELLDKLPLSVQRLYPAYHIRELFRDRSA